jgi:hypothetical protein
MDKLENRLINDDEWNRCGTCVNARINGYFNNTIKIAYQEAGWPKSNVKKITTTLYESIKIKLCPRSKYSLLRNIVKKKIKIETKMLNSLENTLTKMKEDFKSYEQHAYKISDHDISNYQKKMWMFDSFKIIKTRTLETYKEMLNELLDNYQDECSWEEKKSQLILIEKESDNYIDQSFINILR